MKLRPISLGDNKIFRVLLFSFSLFIFAFPAFAQGGPPFYTTDPGTPGPLNWEINVGYMPFLYSDNSVSHTPDVDINFGIGERVQLTYENAWLRVHNPGAATKYGVGQSNPGVKWRFYDAGEDKLQISLFPQLFLNNPNNAVQRGITPNSETLLLPVEFAKKVGPVDINFEPGFEAVRHGPNGWTAGLIVGHDLSERLEVDAEFYSQGTFRNSADAQPVLDVGGRFKLHYPAILLFMAGRSVEPSRPNQAHFVGYFGVQILLPSRAYKRPPSGPGEPER
jgi:hypothetical protein